MPWRARTCTRRCPRRASGRRSHSQREPSSSRTGRGSAGRRLRATHNSSNYGCTEGAPMFVVHSYALAVVLCVLTMFCWGSWANTRKLARRDWRFELFYWDYAGGVLLLTLILGFTLGSTGTEGRPFVA